MDTSIYYYRQFSLSRGKALAFSLISTYSIIQTPVNTDNGHLFLPNQQFLIEGQPCDKTKTKLMLLTLGLKTGSRLRLMDHKLRQWAWVSKIKALLFQRTS